MEIGQVREIAQLLRKLFDFVLGDVEGREPGELLDFFRDFRELVLLEIEESEVFEGIQLGPQGRDLVGRGDYGLKRPALAEAGEARELALGNIDVRQLF